MVARQVDENGGAILEFVGAMRAVRERQEQHVAASHVLVMDEREARSFPKIRVRRGNGLARERFASGDDLVDVRMTDQQPQELAARVTRGAYYSNLHRAALATSRT